MTGVNFIAAAGLAYLIAMVCYIGFIFFKGKIIGYVASFFAFLGVIVHIIGFIVRWQGFYVVNGGHLFEAVPITNLYESLQFFALLLMIVYIIFETITRGRFLGVFATAISGATVLFIDAIGASGAIKPLVPALQSNWLLAHVTLSFIAYVFFAISAISAFIYLVLATDKKTRPFYIFWTIVLGLAISTLIALIYDGIVILATGGRSPFRLVPMLMNKNVISDKIIITVITVIIVIFSWYNGIHLKKLFSAFHLNMEKVDAWTYRFSVTGFAIFTIGGLIFGAIWAEQAWGRYWSWDPKETWAFITWAIYGVYLHGKLRRKWNPVISNSFALLGFLFTIFTYLGVNLFLSGLHSYGRL